MEVTLILLVSHPCLVLSRGLRRRFWTLVPSLGLALRFQCQLLVPVKLLDLVHLTIAIRTVVGLLHPLVLLGRLLISKGYPQYVHHL